jgi:hypothetical protein
MTDRLLMEIAGISISIQSRSATIQRNVFPEYEQFFTNQDHASGNIAVEIDLEMEKLPDTSGMQKIFDSEQSWSMYYNGENYFLTMQPPIFQHPLWVARFNTDFMKATMFYSECFLSRPDESVSVLDPVSYPMDQVLLMYILSKNSGALVHAAGINMNGKGCVFPGKSGAGKSTLSLQFLDRAGVQLLSDDRIILRKTDNIFKAFGTPWPGDARIAENKSAPLSGIFFIYHGDKNIIKELGPKEAIAKLMPVTSIPWYDEKVMTDILSFCEDLVMNVPAYELHFKPDSEVVDFLEKFVSA